MDRIWNKFGLQQSYIEDTVKSFNSYHVMVCRTLDDYINRVFHYNDLCVAVVLRLSLLVTSIRFSVSTIIEDKEWHILLADANHLLGNRRMLSALWSLGFISIALVCATVTHLEYINEFYIYNVYHDILRGNLPR